MQRRGRPRHDDVLTPREWEVLDLLREGLTNEQIASRLGVTHDTAKFHVSEILGKLGVETRQDAARWAGRQRVLRTLGLPVALLRKLTSVPAWQLAGGAVIAAAAIGIGALTVGVFLTDSDSTPEEEAAATTATPALSPTPESLTGNVVLDEMVESLLQEDAPALASRFAGVTAREGYVIGGPVGLYEAREVDTAEWTSRLSAARRTLLAVVQPLEPDNPAPIPGGSPLPFALFFDQQRDYDILLLAEDDSDQPYGWRFSVLGDEVIDVIIDVVEEGEGAPGIGPLAYRLYSLMPSPEDDPGRFLVLPPEDYWPIPEQVERAELEPPAGYQPSIAPDGRTGDAELDEAIEMLLHGDVATLLNAIADVAARREICIAVPDDPNACSRSSERVSAEDWSQRFAATERSLYAVLNRDPADVVIAADTGAEAAEAWRFGVRDGQVLDVEFSEPRPRRPGSTTPFLFEPNTFTPDPGRNYEEFLVLPPVSEQPQPPSSHPLSIRTGAADLDSILAQLAAFDVQGLVEHIASPSTFLVRECQGADSTPDASYAESWAGQLAGQAYGIHAVIQLPEGYQPTADHMVIVVRELNPLDWSVAGILERGGAIVGVIEDCSNPGIMYPPAAYLVPPPEGGLATLDPERQSGVSIVDAVLNAARTRDQAAMADLIDYRPVQCSEPGQIGSLPCPPGTAPGTELDALSVTACEGGFLLPEDAVAALMEVASAPLYAVVEEQEAGSYRAVVVPPDGRGRSLNINQQGVASIRRGCFGGSPHWLLASEGASFLLPPP
jgi:DNA-binding CsgD family transcriptional regulator